MTPDSSNQKHVPELAEVEEFYDGLDALDTALFELPQDIPALADDFGIEPGSDIRETETQVGQMWFEVSELVKDCFSGLSAADHELEPETNKPLYLRAAYPNPSDPVVTVRVTYNPSGHLFVESQYYIGHMSWPFYMGSNEGISTPILYAAAIAAGLNYSSVAVATGQTQLGYHHGLVINSAIGDTHARLEDLRDDSDGSEEELLDSFLDLVKDRPEWTI